MSGTITRMSRGSSVGSSWSSPTSTSRSTSTWRAAPWQACTCTESSRAVRPDALVRGRRVVGAEVVLRASRGACPGPAAGRPRLLGRSPSVRRSSRASRPSEPSSGWSTTAGGGVERRAAPGPRGRPGRARPRGRWTPAAARGGRRAARPARSGGTPRSPAAACARTGTAATAGRGRRRPRAAAPRSRRGVRPGRARRRRRAAAATGRPASAGRRRARRRRRPSGGPRATRRAAADAGRRRTRTVRRAGGPRRSGGPTARRTGRRRRGGVVRSSKPGAPITSSMTSSSGHASRSGLHGSSASRSSSIDTSEWGVTKSTPAQTPSPPRPPTPSRCDSRWVSQRSTPRAGTTTTSRANGSGSGVTSRSARPSASASVRSAVWRCRVTAPPYERRPTSGAGTLTGTRGWGGRGRRGPSCACCCRGPGCRRRP